jgi:hypothetical protein
MENIPDILKLILKDADHKREIAAHNGESHDGGSSTLIEAVEMYRCGLDGRFPSKWMKYKKQYEIECDPDYNTYLRLKQKFGD